MWIRCNNQHTKRLKTSWMDGPISFSETGTAQVPFEVGERLVAEIDAIQPKDTDNE